MIRQDQWIARFQLGDRDAPPGEFQITQGIVTAAFDCNVLLRASNAAFSSAEP